METAMEEPKLANGGGAMPFALAVAILVVGLFVLFGLFYGIVQLF